MYTYADGGRFEGEWIDDKVHGRGVSVYASGNRYEGEWVDGKINGQVRACRVRVHPAALLAERGRVRRVAGYALVRWGRSVPGRVEGWQDARARHLHLRGGRQASLPRRPRRGGGSNPRPAPGSRHAARPTLLRRQPAAAAHGDLGASWTALLPCPDLAPPRRYEGDWKDDRRHGKGTVTYAAPDGGVAEKFEGDWSDGRMHGYGKYLYTDGGIYEGEWLDGKMHGRGLYTFPNGNKYDGEWQNDVKEGYGVLQYINGERYEGYWKDDKAHGKGTLTYIHGDKYVGDWHAAKKQARRSPHSGPAARTAAPRGLAHPPLPPPQGQGELYYANGDMFRGEWLQDRATGHGVLMYANNNRYEGQWLEDRRHGSGSFHHHDGSRYDGEWSNGRKEGKGTLHFANGDSFTGYWSDGVISGPGVLALHDESPWNVADL